MLIAIANLKGGVGKTTLAIQTAAHLEAELFDLDKQGDASDWAARFGHPCQHISEEDAWVALSAAREAKDYVVADCPPAEGVPLRSALALAHLVIIPVLASPQDLKAFGRMRVLCEEARGVNPGLLVACVANNLRAVGMAKDLVEVLTTEKDVVMLGGVGARQAIPDAYAAGAPAFLSKGEAGRELTQVLLGVEKLLRRIGRR